MKSGTNYIFVRGALDSAKLIKFRSSSQEVSAYVKGGLFDNMYHLWHRFSEQINIANVHSPQI